MNYDALMDACRENGVSIIVDVDRDRLEYEAPGKALTPDLLWALKDRKREIMRRRRAQNEIYATYGDIAEALDTCADPWRVKAAKAFSVSETVRRVEEAVLDQYRRLWGDPEPKDVRDALAKIDDGMAWIRRGFMRALGPGARASA